MLLNNLKLALRHLSHQKLFTAINLLGLAAGMAGFGIFALSAGVKLNSDGFHKKGRHIYSVIQVFQDKTGDEHHTMFTAVPLKNVLNTRYSQIEEAVTVLPGGQRVLRKDDHIFYESGVLFVDPQFLDLFSFKMVRGDSRALSEPYSLVMTRSMAKKYFGDANPLGQVLTFEGRHQVTVTGVVQDIPRTSSIKFQFLLSMETARSLNPDIANWDYRAAGLFLMIADSDQKERMEATFPELLRRHYGTNETAPQKMYLFPFRDFRLKGDHIEGFVTSSGPFAVFLLMFLGSLMLVVVSINFINLSIARSMSRAREIGIRKVSGATRGQLLRQYLGESILVAYLALPLGILLFEIVGPLFFSHFPGDGGVTNSIVHYPFLLVYLIFAATLVGVVSGLYPALFLSRIQPVQIFREQLPSRKKKKNRKAMVALQFIVAILFMILANLIKDQFQLIMDADLGFNRDIATIEVSPENVRKIQRIKSHLQSRSDVMAVTAAANIPGVWETSQKVRRMDDPQEKAISVKTYGVDVNFIETLEIPLLRGRSFDPSRGAGQGWIINKAALALFHGDNPLGQELIMGEKTGTVIGVTEDFLFADIGFNIPPALLYLAPEETHYIFARLNPAVPFETFKSSLADYWTQAHPNVPFDCHTIRNEFQDVFRMMDTVANMMAIIGGSVVIFSCLGLLGLAGYMVIERRKEIGIRKVMGASVPRVLWTVSRDFVLPVVWANLITLPLIWFGWRWVLQTGILYLRPLRPSLYLTAAGITVVATLAAVLSQTWKTAQTNPAQSLRHE